MTAAERDAVSSAARAMAGEVQSGDTQGLQAKTIPAVASNFSGIAASVANLKPLVEHATLTVDNVYSLDASTEPAGSAQTDFFCGNPIIVFHFTNLPPAKYALAILHATGVPKPQQISLVLSETTPNQWMLAGFFSRPMIEAGHDGLWYWERAREFAQKKMNLSAWFYYQTAAYLLDPVPFLASPNLQKLQEEASRVRPANLPGATPMTLSVHGIIFQVTGMQPTTELGPWDLEVHYVPDAAHQAQLHDPTAARQQVIDVMTALLQQNPGLRQAFHGMWVRAFEGDSSLFALELPMEQIPAGAQPAASPSPVAQQKTALPAYDPTKPEVQPSLTVDRDPVLSPDVEVKAPVTPGTPAAAAQPGEIQKGKSGVYTLREDVNEVVLNCTVVNEQGKLVKDLRSADFRVWEDGTLQKIDSFQFQDLPVSMGILVDSSGSMRDKRAAVDGAALELVRASNPDDEAFIVNFSNQAYLDQDLTSNISELQQGLQHFDPQNMTALYDAVVASADELSKQAKHPKEVLIIVTDGADNASRLTLAQAVHRVQYMGGPVVYSVGLLFGDDKEEAARAKADLETLSANTGGIAYFPQSLQDVDEIAAEIARDIRHQYTIGYHPTRSVAMGGFRVVRVEAEAPGHGKLIVRTSKGYYPKREVEQRQKILHVEPIQSKP
ncbi:MAG TPA: VWA domain-containing protein [Acidobacteriaceae bacterium]|nr:VWA domain-containing protein [Acidobacteriaceae bacterium]